MYTCAWEQSTHSNQSSIYLKTSVNTPLAWLKSTCTTAAIQTPGRTRQESYDLTNSPECQSSFILGRIISTNKLFCTSKLGEKTTKHETNKWRGYKHTQPDCCSLKFHELDSKTLKEIDLYFKQRTYSSDLERHVISIYIRLSLLSVGPLFYLLFF